MDFLLAQGITETVEVKPNPITENSTTIETPVKKEELPTTSPPAPIGGSSFGGFVAPMLPVPKLPMGTMTETITITSPKLPLGTIPTIPETRVAPVKRTSTIPVTQKKELSYEEKYGAGSLEEIKQEPNGQITIRREICDGEVHLGPFKSCLKEFTGIPAVGWIAAAAGLIVLWKWLDYKFRK